MGKLIVFATLALLAGLLAVGDGQATAAPAILVVDDDGTFNAATNGCDGTDAAYTTISAAIAAAGSGDTALVCPGHYPEQLIINKPLTVRPTAGPAVTTVGANLYLVWIQASNVTLEGFTITNPNEMSTADNSAIICTGAGNVSNIKILNNVIEAPASPSRPSADFGTFGINCITGGSLQNIEVAYNTFRNIHAPASAVAIAIFFYSNTTSSGINIHDNVIYKSPPLPRRTALAVSPSASTSRMSPSLATISSTMG